MLPECFVRELDTWFFAAHVCAGTKFVFICGTGTGLRILCGTRLWEGYMSRFSLDYWITPSLAQTASKMAIQSMGS